MADATIPPPDREPAPVFRRAERSDALELARAQYVAGERVDMGALATQLGIGRTTLYRWVGDRDQLLGEVLADLATEAMAAEQIPGAGSARFLAAVRRYCETAIGDQAFLEFLRREPDTALRVVMSRRGPVVQRIADVIERLLDELHPPAGGASNRELAELMVQVATALVSGAFAIGDEPDIDRAIRVVRALLDADESVRSRR